jgi:hypothetical protein
MFRASVEECARAFKKMREARRNALLLLLDGAST